MRLTYGPDPALSLLIEGWNLLAQGPLIARRVHLETLGQISTKTLKH